MGPALLFTYYRNPETSTRRLLCLRALNPGLAIHGLYTGTPQERAGFEELRDLLDSDYHHPPAPPQWLWSNYDKVIARWFAEWGHNLPFGWLWIHSWDLLLLDPLSDFVATLEPDQVVLPGLRALEEMDEEILDPLLPPHQPMRWSWLQEPQFVEFQAYWKAHYDKPLYCEVSPFGILGRWVCQRYAEACFAVPGHNEYRFPSLAAALGARLWRGDFAAELWQRYDPNPRPWTLKAVLELAAQPPGRRLCHPVYYPIEPAHLRC